MKRGLFDIGQIHRNLRNAILFDIPTDGFDSLAGPWFAYRLALLAVHNRAVNGVAIPFDPPLFTHVKGYGIGTAHRAGVEVDVVSDKEIARPHRCGAGSGVKLGGAVIGFPLWLG